MKVLAINGSFRKKGNTDIIIDKVLEASGTSGMKAAVNGVLNLSVVDGWVAEGPQHGVSGWLLCSVCGKSGQNVNQDEQDLRTLYNVLLNEVVPTYYGNSTRWHNMMRASIDMAHYQFSSHRMLREYYDVLYHETVICQQEDVCVASFTPETHYVGSHQYQ